MPLDQIASGAFRTRLQSLTIDALEPDLLAGYVGELIDVARLLLRVRQQEHAAAGARQRNVEQSPLFGIGEGLGLRNDEVEQLIVLDAAAGCFFFGKPLPWNARKRTA